MREEKIVYPKTGSVIFKLVRTLLGALFLIAVGVLFVWAAIQLTGLPFISVILNTIQPFLWGVLIVYLLFWLAIYFSYKDYLWAARLCEAKESYDMGRYRKTVNYATFALAFKKNCSLSYYLRSKAYEELEPDSLPRSDYDMALSLGLNPDQIDL